MSIASPQNREELKQYIVTKLGAPVLQINVSDEQLDLAIDDAFQFFVDRQHYNATERMYLSVRVTESLEQFFRSGFSMPTGQVSEPVVTSEGMVKTLTLTNPGSGYPITNAPGEALIAIPATGGSGSGLLVNVDTPRTTSGGLVSVTVHGTGSGYLVGDEVTISMGDNNAVFTVTEIQTEAPLNGGLTFEQQNNYMILPKGVRGVSRILRKSGFRVGGGVIPGVGMFNPFLMGGAGGEGACAGMYFGLTSYYTMQQYMATLEWMMYNPISYNFNQRTHRLFINADSFRVSTGDFLCLEVDMVPSLEMFPDMWNDQFLKRLAVAYTQLAWGRVLTKYQNVQLPGGITMNGDAIVTEAKEEIQMLTDRFAMDYADPPLDIVG